MKKVIYVSIGNSDDKLTQRRWSAFCAEVKAVCGKAAVQIIGVWYSRSDDMYQNACFSFTPIDDTAEAKARYELGQIATEFNQDGIAWAECPSTVLL